MQTIKKALRIIVFSNLAVFGFILFLPVFLLTGDIEIVKEFLAYLNKE